MPCYHTFKAVQNTLCPCLYQDFWSLLLYNYLCSRVSSECYHTFAKLVPYGISRVVTMVLGGLLDPLKSAVKFKKEIDKDNFTFKLFYRGSYGLCILASTLVGASSYIGDPIECDPGVQYIH